MHISRFPNGLPVTLLARQPYQGVGCQLRLILEDLMHVLGHPIGELGLHASRMDAVRHKALFQESAMSSPTRLTAHTCSP